jgi:hypothetical protein
MVVAAAGCGANEEKRSGAEGEFIEAGEALYQVQLTRLLNPRDRPDDQLLRGQAPATRDEQYLAVFLKIENKGSESYSPPRDMRVVDTEGNQYLPLDATQSGFGLDLGSQIPPGDEAPPPGSPAAEGPNAAAMLLFRVKTQSATDNLPLVLEVPSGEKAVSRITLDV